MTLEKIVKGLDFLWEKADIEFLLPESFYKKRLLKEKKELKDAYLKKYTSSVFGEIKYQYIFLPDGTIVYIHGYTINKGKVIPLIAFKFNLSSIIQKKDYYIRVKIGEKYFKGDALKAWETLFLMKKYTRG